METSKFAQRLAANEQPKRDRAIKKLRKYIAAKTAKTGGFSIEELLQLWKGLHYCFWMQDKPLLQEELSAKLCGLLKAFPDADSALVFAAAFFLTQAREWGRLDQWRMDKYMMLIRDFLHATLEVVKGKQWETSLIGSVSAMVGEVMDAMKEEFPDGLRLHLADIYLEEVEKVGAEELTGDQINVLLDPFLQYVANSKRDVIANKIIAKIFGPILQASSTDHQHCEESGEESTGPRLQFNYSGLQQMMFDAGRQKNILPKVRRKLYRLVKRFSDAATEGTQSAVQHGKRKRTGSTGEEAEAPKEKKMKKEDEDVQEDSEECPVPSEQNHMEQPVTASPHRKNKHRKKHMDQETPQSASKHVAFDLDRNSSRGLQEFVISTASSSSPFLPTRSPSHGILKESPGVTPLAGKETTKGASRKGHKRLKKEKASSSKEHSAVWYKEKLVAEKTTSSKGKKLFKFHSKKKEKMMKKPKHR